MLTCNYSITGIAALLWLAQTATQQGLYEEELDPGEPPALWTSWRRARPIPVVARDGGAIARVHDLIVDRRTGVASHAVLTLTVAGRSIMKVTPYGVLEPKPHQGGLALRYHGGPIAELSEFDGAWLTRLNAQARRRDARVIQASAPRASEPETPPGSRLPRYLLASPVLAERVDAADGPLGPIVDLAFDTWSGEVGYVLLDSVDRARVHAIPWTALQFADDRDPIIDVRRGVVLDGPTVERANLKQLGDPILKRALERMATARD